MAKKAVTDTMEYAMREILESRTTSRNITTWRRLRSRGLAIQYQPDSRIRRYRMCLTAKGYQYASERGWLKLWEQWAAEIDIENSHPHQPAVAVYVDIEGITLADIIGALDELTHSELCELKNAINQRMFTGMGFDCP